jgi:hypothetical protein
MRSLSCVGHPSHIFRNRMLASAQNFALGFFEYTLEDQYHRAITIGPIAVGPVVRSWFGWIIDQFAVQRNPGPTSEKEWETCVCIYLSGISV